MRRAGGFEKLGELEPVQLKGEILHQNQEYRFPDEVECIRIYADWEIRNVGINCELELVVYCCDDRVSTVACSVM